MQLSRDRSRLQTGEELAEILCCTFCRASLKPEGDGFVCTGCARSFPRIRGVVRFVDPDNYAASFGFQWQYYDRTQLDRDDFREAENHFRMKTGLRPDDLKGKLVLDVGCGMGRFAEVATRWGGTVVGIDLSAAAEVAARNLAERDFAALQADVFHLPFAAESFDIIYSLGVLHHTPDCEQAVKVLPQYLRRGGHLAVWLYSGYNKWYRFSDIYRKYTHRMSPKTLHRVMQVVVPLFYTVGRGLRAIPGIGKPLAGAVHHLFPVNQHGDAETRVLNTFDWYSPKYQSKHTYEEVFRWFEDSGLEDLHVGERPIAVWGKKPS
jgi:2-polyprenyl-3-methyl-5-hydroxy-6-metoxy-1,4-benzoquinol methylase